MTPELLEFRKWGVISELIEEYSEGAIEPVVLKTPGIGMLIISGDKAFFFFSAAKGIAINIWMADTSEAMAGASMLFPEGMPDAVTFREIARLAIAKTFS